MGGSRYADGGRQWSKGRFPREFPEAEPAFFMEQFSSFVMVLLVEFGLSAFLC
jgi:hypothetical protein